MVDMPSAWVQPGRGRTTEGYPLAKNIMGDCITKIESAVSTKSVKIEGMRIFSGKAYRMN